jgi:hypothetical protein
MAAPLILSDRGDIAVFETICDLERYVESPDAAEYRVYDASGQRYFFKGYQEPSKVDAIVRKVQSVQLDEEHPGPQATEELAQLLRSYLQRVGYREPVDSWPLQQLVKKTIELSGYTR